MPTVKYFEKITEAQRSEAGREPAEEFDLEKLGGGSFVARVLGSPLFWRVLRNVWPIVLWGRVAILTRADDVREVRARQDVFGVPFGPEMTELAGGKNFFLGMDPGPEYARQLRHIHAAFRATDPQQILIPMAKRLAASLVASSGGEIDVFEDLLVRVPTEVMVEYFGLELDDPVAFVDWLMAISTLLFGDPFGDKTVRKLALAGTLRARPVIDRAIGEANTGRLSPDTLIARLVALKTSDPEPPTDAEIRAIVLGLTTGFVPTIALGAGHILEVLLANKQFWAQAVDAACDVDDQVLERC